MSAQYLELLPVARWDLVACLPVISRTIQSSYSMFFVFFVIIGGVPGNLCASRGSGPNAYISVTHPCGQTHVFREFNSAPGLAHASVPLPFQAVFAKQFSQDVGIRALCRS